MGSCAEILYVPSAFETRIRIAELEEEERMLRLEDRRFWEHPDHTPEAQAAYQQRPEQIQRVREELQVLHRDLAIESARPVRH